MNEIKEDIQNVEVKSIVWEKEQIIAWCEKFKNASEKDFEKIRADLERFMVEQMRELDQECGIPSPEQDLTATEFKRNLRNAKKQKSKK